MTAESRFWPIVPAAAPRQSQRDKWKPTTTVLRYRAFRDECRIRKVWAPQPGDTVIFFMPIPNSATQKRRDALHGTPHMQKPDVDNLKKALMDASYADDAHIWAIEPLKFWSKQPGIYILRPENTKRLMRIVRAAMTEIAEGL